MKKPITLVLLVLLLVTACGKESKEDKSPVNTAPGLTNEDVITEATQRVIDAVNAGNYERLDQLLINGDKANLDVILPNGETLLTQILRSGNVTIARRLIEGGASINKKNRRGETPLMMAALKGYVDFMKNTLFPMRVDADAQDNNGDTALHFAILNSQEVAANSLIDYGAEVRITNSSKKNSEVLAREMGMINLLKRIINIIDSQRGRPDRSKVKNAVIEGNINLVDEMLGLDPAIIVDYADLNLLFLAVREIKEDHIADRMVDILLTRQANANGFIGSLNVPIIEAVKKNRQNIIKLLLDYKADPNLQDENGLTALIHAVRANNPEITKNLYDKNALKRYKAKVNGKDKKINACSVARDVKDDLKTKEEKERNKDIKDILVCGLRFLPFI
ncbi:MAG: ankyrin repeat domain-containing protein [Bacteriovoracaceae bacterium]|jgi:ankyrin repeat protein